MCLTSYCQFMSCKYVIGNVFIVPPIMITSQMTTQFREMGATMMCPCLRGFFPGGERRFRLNTIR